jgi:hypothetical protein
MPATSAFGRRSLSQTGSGSLALVLGEQAAVVLEVRPWDVHGVGHVDVSVVYPDRTMETARLGRESVPEDIAPGDQVLVVKAMNVMVEIRRPGA